MFYGAEKKCMKLISVLLVAGILASQASTVFAQQSFNSVINAGITAYDVEVENAGKGDWVYDKAKKNYWFKTDSGNYLANGIYMIAGKEYAFDKNGWMIRGWYRSGGSYYYFVNDGSMVKGWLQTGGKWYYLDQEDGYMYDDGPWMLPNGTIYMFNKSGELVDRTGWYQWSDQIMSMWFWLNKGAVKTGWLQAGGRWYYLDHDYGFMYEDGVRQVANGTAYVFNKSGQLIDTCTGWYQYDDLWFWLNRGGAVKRGWLQTGGRWYYLDGELGYMYDDGVYQLPNGSIYLFNKSGQLIDTRTGWYLYDNTWYWINNGGSLKRGWLLTGGSWYYLDSVAGNMYCDGIYEIDGGYSEFSASGRWLGYYTPEEEVESEF